MNDAKELLGAIARGWCHPKNGGKVMDPDLAIAIAAEVNALLSSEALERDAARLDWFEANPNAISYAIGYLGSKNTWMRTRGEYVSVPHNSLREAIDAAMSAQSDTEESK